MSLSNTGEREGKRKREERGSRRRDTHFPGFRKKGKEKKRFFEIRILERRVSVEKKGGRQRIS